MNDDKFETRAAIMEKYHLDNFEKYEHLVQRTSEIFLIDRSSAVEFLYQVLPIAVNPSRVAAARSHG